MACLPQLSHGSVLASVCLALLLALPRSDAASFGSERTTSSTNTTSLNHGNPAFGGAPPTTTTATNSEERTFTVDDDESSTANDDLQSLETYFGESLEMNVNNMASNAAFSVVPWPGSYWPVYLDGINYQWGSGASAAEKYATAFGLDVDSFTQSVSESTGILSMASSSTSCWSDWDCTGDDSGSACAIRAGEWTGYCIPTWYGICHAWAPASLLESEPNCAAEMNGVTFQPMDIKALMSEIYDGANVGTVFAGTRYDGSDTGAATDEYGRYTDTARRDLDPGFMHIALANVIGKFGISVIMDVSGGSEVWNQPVYSYDVLTQTELTPSDAARQYFQTDSYPFNDDAERIMYTETSVTWVVEGYEDGGIVTSGNIETYENSQTYTYLLELDSDYNVLGGEWVGDAMDDHPDFLWFPKGRPDSSTVTEVGLSYANVRELLELATNC